MKKNPYLWAMSIVFLAPMVYHVTLKEPLVKGLADSRAIYQAQPLETIQGARAGNPVQRDLAREDTSYEVRAGDSWWAIAQRFRIRDASQLASHNDNVALVPGITINIPASLLEQRP